MVPGQANPEAPHLITQPYFGIQTTDSVQLLAPEVVSTSLFENNGTFSPDGKAFYYTVGLPNRGQIAFMEMGDDNRWTAPRFASFSSQYSEVDALFSPDGKRLYFTSNRPTNKDAKAGGNHIWFVEKTADGWGDARMVALTEQGDYYSSLTTDGTIYFNSWRSGDIFRAIPTDSTHLVERLPDVINLNKSVGDPFISPEEDYLIFRGNNLANTLGSFDLYISFKVDHEWTEPLNLGAPINSPDREVCPFVTSDGKMFIFASNRLQQKFETQPMQSTKAFKNKMQSYDNGSWNIYCTSTDFIERLREKALSER